MQAGDCFNIMTQSAVDFENYTLLPVILLILNPYDKQKVVVIVKGFDTNSWDLGCCLEFQESLRVTQSDLHFLQPFIFLAVEDPSYLYWGMGETEKTLEVAP